MVQKSDKRNRSGDRTHGAKGRHRFLHLFRKETGRHRGAPKSMQGIAQRGEPLQLSKRRSTLSPAERSWTWIVRNTWPKV